MEIFIRCVIIVLIVKIVIDLIYFSIKWKKDNDASKIDSFDMGAALDRWRDAELEFQAASRKEKEDLVKDKPATKIKNTTPSDNVLTPQNKLTLKDIYSGTKFLTLDDLVEEAKMKSTSSGTNPSGCVGCHVVCKNDCTGSCGRSCKYACVGICGGLLSMEDARYALRSL